MAGTVLFDLDGTLTESGPGIMNSVAYALNKHGITGTDREKLRLFIGPPLIDSFMKYCGMDRQEAEQALQDYREYFLPHGIYENEVYPGVRDMLKALRSAGKCLIVATSKPDKMALTVLKYFGLLDCFDAVMAATMDEKRSRKDEVIAYAIETLSLDPADTVMVGDRKDDIEGGHRFGLETVGVLYGYGSREELTAAGADHLAETPMDVIRYC